jgi:hypothetical protein
LTDFHGNEAKKNQGLVLGLVELIDSKGIDLAQPIWCRLSDVSSKTLNRQNIFCFVFRLFLRLKKGLKMELTLGITNNLLITRHQLSSKEFPI